MLLIQLYYGQINQNSSRILRSSRTWLESHPKGQVIVIGFTDTGDKIQHSELEPGIQAYNIWVDQKLFNSIPFFGRLRFIKSWRKGIFRLLSTLDLSNLKIIMPNSVSDLPIGYRIQKKYGGKLIYDAHELETERNELKGIHKWYDKWIEKRYIRYTEVTLVVSTKIKDWYQTKYPEQQIELIRNLPSLQTNTSPTRFNRKTLGIPENQLIFIYIGKLNPGRGIEALLTAFQEIDHAALFLMGNGRLLDLIKEKSKIQKNIYYHPPVNSTEVVDFIRLADVGLSIIENTCLSYYYCLPNKLWEYLHAGLPVIVSDFPEMRSFVEQNQVGWAIQPNPKSINELVHSINYYDIETVKKKIAESKFISWQSEKEKLKKVFLNLCSEDS